MAYFPMFVDLEGARVLIAGGGPEALTKAQRLLPYGPELTVISPDPCRELCSLPGIRLEKRAFQATDLSPAPALVILAEGNRDAIARACRQRRIAVNSVDDIPNCDFYFPSLIQRGDLSIGICSAGAAPAVSVLLRQRIEALLPQALEQIMPWIAEQTRHLRQINPDSRERGAVLRRLTQAAFEKNRPLTEGETKEFM